MKKVYIYDYDGYFAGADFPQIDPLESQKAGREILIMPANSTDVEPPEEKEGFNIKWNGASWEYVKIQIEPEIEPYEPTEEDRLRERLWQIEEEFRQLDYIGIKIATGRATVAEYAKEIERMEELAAEKNEIMAKLAEKVAEIQERYPYPEE